MDPSDAKGSSSNDNPQASSAPQVEKTSERGGDDRQSGAAARSSPPPPVEPVPVFLDRTYTIVDTASDDVVSWSEAGDSFIIRQVDVFEGLLPAYYNHKNFLSFVRQLNFYGFSKVKKPSTQSSSALGSAGDGGKRQWRDSDSWEFKHPKFRRGCKELLVGIKRRKDGGRLKRRRVDMHSDVLQDLMRDVEQVTADLQAVDDKVDGIKSLLLSMSGRPGPYPATPQAPQDGGVFGYDANPAFVPTAVAHAGGFERWGGATVGGPDPYMYGAPLAINYLSSRPPLDQRSWWQPPLQRQCIPRDQYFVPQQAPPAACFPVNTAFPRQLPLDGSPRGHGLAPEHTGKVINLSTVRPPSRGIGHYRASISSGTDYADHHGVQGVWRSPPAPNPDQLLAARVGGGSEISSGTGDMQQDLSEGKMSMLEVLSHSAASAVETPGEEG